MKEFTSQTGGRYTYIDDIINLQELSLAFTSIFDGCENFIISGCRVSGNTISAGYVYINSKIRYCAGTSNASKWPMYIYESNYSEKVPYADSSDKMGRNIYGCAVASTVPTTNDALTGALPQSLSIAADGSAIRLQDAFLGKYGLLLTPSKTSQTINKNVIFNGLVTAINGLVVKDSINLIKGSAQTTISYDTSGALTIQSVINGNKTHKMVITEDGEFQFYANNVLLGIINSQGASLKVAIAADMIKGGNLTMTSNHFYNNGYASDEAAVNINMLGYNGGVNYYRNTFIGDGKGHVLVSVSGKDKNIILNGSVRISYAASSLTFAHPTLSRTDKSLMNYCQWIDKNGDEMAVMGYASQNDLDWHIKTKTGNIRLDNSVYINGSLYVNDINIMSHFVDINSFDTALNKKANTNDVYTKNDADNLFIKCTDSITVFVTQAGGGTNGQAAVCRTIGACSTADFADATLKSKGFQDIVSYGLPGTEDPSYASKLEERKRALCTSIGAAYAQDVQGAPKDTGWIAISVKNCGITTKIYVRQIGNMVSIQGQLHTHHSGTIFTLPNTVDPPKYEIGYSHNRSGNWHCVIKGGSRDCIVDYCNGGCSEYIGFLMTFLV